MPKNGLMAFCTFYKNLSNGKINKIGYDYCYKETTVLTKLKFKLKTKNQNLIK